MHIYGPAHLHGVQPIHSSPASRVSRPTAAASGSPIQDELHISAEAEFLQQVHELPEIRQDRVNQIRAQIAQGTYETEAKMQIALGRLLDEIG